MNAWNHYMLYTQPYQVIITVINMNHETPETGRRESLAFHDPQNARLSYAQ